MKLLSFGEILWDIYPDEKYLGGAPLNFAAHFVKHGGEAYMLSALGNDKLGNEALNKLSLWKVNAEYVSVLSGKETGKCLVSLNQCGVPSYDIVRDCAYDFIDCSGVSDGFDVLYFGTLALRNAENRHEIKNLIKSHSFREIFVDINLRKPFINRESIMLCLENATILKISDEELPMLTAVLGKEYTDNFVIKISKAFKNIGIIIITLGERGSFVYNCRNGRSYSCDAKKVKVASTVGAGDSFSAAFLYRYMSGVDINECLGVASRVSAYVVSKTEAVPEYNPDKL